MSKSRSKEAPATLEITTNAGRARFGFGHLPYPEEGGPLCVRIGLGGLGKENLKHIAEESGKPVPEAFLALHRRRLKKQELLTLTGEEGLGEGDFGYWVFHNASLETGCLLGFTLEALEEGSTDITIHSERWFQSPCLISAQELIFDLWERDFIPVQQPAFGYRTLRPGTLPLDRLRRNWHALFQDEEARANLGDDEITFEEFWEACLDDK